MIRPAAALGATLLGASALLYAAVARAASGHAPFPDRVAWIEGAGVAAGWYDVTDPDAAFREARREGLWQDGVRLRSGELRHGDRVTLIGPWAILAPRVDTEDGAVASGGTDRAVAPSTPGGAPPAQVPSVPVRLNAATLDDLVALPGIGPALARRIVEGRPYRTVAELDRVKGIGPRKLAALRGRVTP